MIFGGNWMSEAKFQRFLTSNPLLLIAYTGNKAIGFKAGYQVNERTFHSWLGGVHPEFRQQGIAQRLLEKQEEWVRSQGFVRITFNTYERYAAMMRFSEKNGYALIRSEMVDGEMKYFYEKRLKRNP